MPQQNTNNSKLAIVHLGCEVSKTLKGGCCELAGEVRFADVLLCRRHARQLQAQDRVLLLRGILSCLEISLRSLPLRRDRNLTLLLRAQRAQATRELYRAHEELQQLKEEEDAS
jgi:hypothetical protein